MDDPSPVIGLEFNMFFVTQDPTNALDNTRPDFCNLPDKERTISGINGLLHMVMSNIVCRLNNLHLKSLGVCNQFPPRPS